MTSIYVIKLPILGGSNLMQMYGNFEGLPYNWRIVGVRNLMLLLFYFLQGFDEFN